ncbi:hypothetical protein ABNE29_15015 [Paenibacillus larvae]
MAMGLQRCEAGLPALKRTGVHILSVHKVSSRGRNYSEIGKSGYACHSGEESFQTVVNIPFPFFLRLKAEKAFKPGEVGFFIQADKLI